MDSDPNPPPSIAGAVHSPEVDVTEHGWTTPDVARPAAIPATNLELVVPLLAATPHPPPVPVEAINARLVSASSSPPQEIPPHQNPNQQPQAPVEASDYQNVAGKDYSLEEVVVGKVYYLHYARRQYVEARALAPGDNGPFNHPVIVTGKLGEEVLFRSTTTTRPSWELGSGTWLQAQPGESEDPEQDSGFKTIRMCPDSFTMPRATYVAMGRWNLWKAHPRALSPYTNGGSERHVQISAEDLEGGLFNGDIHLADSPLEQSPYGERSSARADPRRPRQWESRRSRRRSPSHRRSPIYPRRRPRYSESTNNWRSGQSDNYRPGNSDRYRPGDYHGSGSVYERRWQED